MRYPSLQSIFYTFNWFIFILVLAVTTLYVYGRLDFVRSGPKPTSTQPLTPSPIP